MRCYWDNYMECYANAIEAVQVLGREREIEMKVSVPAMVLSSMLSQSVY